MMWTVVESGERHAIAGKQLANAALDVSDGRLGKQSSCHARLVGDDDDCISRFNKTARSFRSAGHQLDAIRIDVVRNVMDQGAVLVKEGGRQRSVLPGHVVTSRNDIRATSI